MDPSSSQTIESDEDSSVVLLSTDDSSSSYHCPSVEPLKYVYGSSCAIEGRGSISSKHRKSAVENFRAAIDKVKENPISWSLLGPNVVDVMSTFSTLSNDAQKLYVDLLSSKNIWQRKTTFKTVNGNEEIFIMERKGLITTDYSTESIELLLRLLSAAEIRAICRSLKMKPLGSRRALIKAHLKSNVGEITEVQRRISEKLGVMLKLTDGPRDIMLNTLLLKSVPHAQLLTKDGRSPILSVMRMVTANSLVSVDYSISSVAPIYHSRDHFLRSVDAMKLNGKIRDCVRKKKWSNFSENFDVALQAFKDFLEERQTRMRDDELPKCLRQFTAGSILADALLNSMDGLKMVHEYDEVVIGYRTLLGQVTYKSNERGLWYDQLAVALYNAIEAESAIDVLTEGLLDSSLDPIYRVILSSRFSAVNQSIFEGSMWLEKVEILRSLMLDVKEPKIEILRVKSIRGKRPGSHKMKYMLESDTGTGPTFSSMERVVIDKYCKLGFDDGLIGGDAFSLSLVGIFLWDILYSMNVPNAFISRYQTQPADLITGDFYHTRESEIQKRVKEVTEVWTQKEMDDFVDDSWQNEGRESLVTWKMFRDKAHFKEIISVIGKRILAAICLYVSKVYVLARHGFPGIMVWNTNTKEVKFLAIKKQYTLLSAFETGWLETLDVAGADVSLVEINVAPLKDVEKRRRMQPQHGEGSKTE